MNSDGKLSMEEAIAYAKQLANPVNNKTSAEELAQNTDWFMELDKNGNGAIDPEEFDQSLEWCDSSLIDQTSIIKVDDDLGR